MKLTRKRIKYGSYNLEDENGVVIARADKTGTRRDNYPWDWQLADGFEFGSNKAGFGHEESLRACICMIQDRVAYYGLTGEE